MTQVGINGNNVSKFIHSDKFREVLTWTVPPVTPLFRYAIDKRDMFKKTQDEPELQNKKKKLLNRDLVRDIAIYSLGTAMYFASLVGIDKTLEKTTKMAPNNRKVAAFLGALAINVAYVSAGASKLSKAILKIQKSNESKPNDFIYSSKINTPPALSLNNFSSFNNSNLNNEKAPLLQSSPELRARTAFLNFSVYNKLNSSLLNKVISMD